MNGADIFTKYGMIGIGGLLFCLVIWWYYKAAKLVDGFFLASSLLLGQEMAFKKKFLPFYSMVEIRGIYKGREVFIGIRFAGLNAEFLPLPFIQMRLKETVGYNYNRLPNYAMIKERILIYKLKISLLWGVFDKGYPRLFSKNYLIIALERLMATAEDVERGRTIKETF